MENIYEVSNILNTGLDRETLSILVNLCEAGVNPEALAVVVKKLRTNNHQKKQQQKQSNTGTSSNHVN